VSAAALEVRGVGKRYGALEALREVSFAVSPGELVAILGPNGAGKTTLLSIVAGILAPSAGELAHGSGEVGWAPQHAALYSKLTVAENLGLFARLARVADAPATVERMLDQTGLHERAGELVGKLSGGNRQRVNIAIGLLSDPPLLALDEPSASLDPSQRERLWAFVAERAAAGTAVLFSTHNASEAQRHASRVLVLDEGTLRFDGSPGELMSRFGDADLERSLVRFLEGDSF
jgi:ABC-2 type transport system ATP-binding protein